MPRLSVGTRTYKGDDGKEREHEFLMFDGVEVEHCNPSLYEGKISVHVNEGQMSRCMPDLRVSELMEDAHRFGIYPSETHFEELGLIIVASEFEMYPIVEDGDLVFACVVDLNWQNWNKPWSPADFVDTMIEMVNEFPEVEDCYYGPIGSDDYQAVVQFEFKDWDRLILDELEENWRMTKRFVRAVERRMQEKLNENSLVSHFNFPTEIRTSCEQYLLFFIQFLKDVGVEASAQIQHEGGDAGDVLFSVTPADGKQGLDKVRQALQVYLKLSQAPNMRPDFSAPDDVQTLQRQIRYLQTELDFAEGKVKQRDLTLELQETLIAQLKERSVFEQASEETAEREDGKAALLKSTVYLKRFDAGFAEIDFPAIYDLIRKWITAGHENEDLITYFKRHGLKLFERPAPTLPPADRPALPPTE